MVEVTFEIKGKKVQPDNMSDALDLAFLKHIMKKIHDSVGSVCCLQHGQKPAVLVIGQDLDNLDYEVSGCCEDLIRKVKKKIPK